MLQHDTYGPVHYWEVARSYLGKQLYTTGFFYLDGVLIDCGPANTLPRLKPLFSDLTIDRVLITHHHEDHSGNAFHLNRSRGISIFAHPDAPASLEDVSRNIPFYRNLIWGRPQSVVMENIPLFVETNARTLEVIHTPGHSEDHLCFWDGSNSWLFTGDLYLASYLRYLREDEDIFEIMRSLRKLIDLRPKVLFCNHRGPIENGEQALSKKLSFLERMRDEVQTAVEKGIPLNRVAAQLLKKDLFFRFFSAGEFSTMNLLRAFAGVALSDNRGTSSPEAADSGESVDRSPTMSK